ncbi:PilZ domain-containing protein [uncultured Sphingomonas sp.]|uniref:PilZ domain-containing protein n=1 Tax=uncultured Sphingomonas sp. TaxID=158754 RepID=UPI0035C9C85C
MPEPFPFGSSSADDAGSGARSRDSLFLMARLRTPSLSETFSVRIRNLSPGGLMADFATPLERDTPVQIDVRGIGWVPGKVAWFAEGRTGIAFDAPIDPSKARKPIALRPAPASAPRPRSR